jgi:hypothetical protein
VTLLLTPAESALLTLSRRQGEYEGMPVSFLLRPPGDVETGARVRVINPLDISIRSRREALSYTGYRQLFRFDEVDTSEGADIGMLSSEDRAELLAAESATN